MVGQWLLGGHAALGSGSQLRKPSADAIAAAPGKHVGVYVMLPLWSVGDDGSLNEGMSTWLNGTKNSGADGIMVDVWWGLTEKASQVYDFMPYQQLVTMACALGLKVQMVASFHQCGGNVGDDCSIPLPGFVRNNTDIWYTDAQGRQNTEYISLWADAVKLGDGRTPLQMYAQWFQALSDAFAPSLGNTIVELQVGLGPCGELRYPSYYSENGWSYPGIGQFQCYDPHALESLAASAPAGTNWTAPPAGLGDYNSKPSDSSAFFFQTGYKTEVGQHFLEWYSGGLIRHASEVLGEARRVFSTLPLAAKVAGMHWWYDHDSHAAELTAGYYNTNAHNAYLPIAQMLKTHDVSLDFTCMEMRNSEQSGAENNPEALVGQVARAARDAGIELGGENALARYDETAYEQIVEYKPVLSSFTYLRLSATLLGSGLEAFSGFVGRMQGGAVGKEATGGRLRR
uniref:Beta-amylase n=1 Tax=Zooxanthella nutricula TaxID=1333877 RepID=A0A7S2KFC9_9DINO